MILLIACSLIIILPVLFFLTVFLIFLTVTIYAKIKLEPVRGVCTFNVRLDGKIALVTGGNQGIGLETARNLAARGASVVIACRDAQKAAKAIADISSTTGNKNVEFRPLDLAKFSSVRKFAKDFNNSYERLDILVNNAGCSEHFPKPTEDGIDVVMQVNYLGPFLLTNLLLDKLIASKPSRIIIVSSCLHYFTTRLRVENLQKPATFTTLGLGQLLNYGTSKLCQIVWTKALAKRLPDGVTVNSLHPGLIKTEIYSKVPSCMKKMFYVIADAVLFRTAAEGAQTTIHLCISKEVEGVRGKYFMECKEAEYSRMADDDELVEKVWNRSIKLTSSS